MSDATTVGYPWPSTRPRTRSESLSIATASNSESEAEGAPLKKGRGRPPKRKIPSGTTREVSSAKRGRGRPRNVVSNRRPASGPDAVANLPTALSTVNEEVEETEEHDRGPAFTGPRARVVTPSKV